MARLKTAVARGLRAGAVALRQTPERGPLAAAILVLVPPLGLAWHLLQPPAPAPVPVSDGTAPAALAADARSDDPAAAPPRLHILYTDGAGSLGPSPIEKEMLQQYSRRRGLEPVWIPVADARQLRQALQNGTGEVAVPPDAAASAAGPVLQATLPWAMSRQQVVGREGSGRLESPEDLGLRQIAVRRDSPAWTRLQVLQRTHPAMDLVPIGENLTDRQILERVNSGRYDLAVLDNLALQSYLPYYPDLKVQLDLGRQQPRHWLVRRGSEDLLDSLNQFLNKTHLELNLARVYREDLPQLQKRKLLRLITVRSPVNYYFDNGRLKGFEYDLIKRFARKHGMRVDVVMADTPADMRALLRQGRGDIIAASLPEQSFADARGVRTTQAYNYAAPVVVGRSHDESLLDVTDLDGRSVWLPAESPWYGLLQSIRRQGVDVEIHRAGDLNTEAVLFRVARGLYDLTIVGSQEVKAELSRQLNLRVQFPLSGSRPLVWAVRKSDTQLLSALDDYIGEEYRQGFYNVVYNRYIIDPAPQKANADLLAGVDRLSPFDQIVHDYAEDFGFDWRLIVAQMYQESRFDPAAVSGAGAEGLMQLLPAAAEQVGVTQRDDPAKSIRGGIRYLDYLRGRFEEPNLPLEERTWFTLAAYNAGYNRVRQARQLAENMGLNPNRWFDNVEKAMLRLSRPYRKDGELVRACRCGQTVVYVRDIRTLYNNYVRLTQSTLRTAEREPAGQAVDSNAL